MNRLGTTLAGLALVLALVWPGGAAAQAPTPAPAPAPAPPADPSTSADVDAELRKMADDQLEDQGEVVEIFEARPRPPIERNTDVRFTYEQLAAQGVTDLASALRLLPDVTVRDGGRGGFNIDVRGGRKGSVTVLIDGISVSDPYYGTFDVSTIPVTDIVQIRMSPNLQSPLDGPGGPSAVIEVLTRDAIGKQLVIARVTGDSLPSFGVTGMAKVALAKHYALRLSMSGQAGGRDQPVFGTAEMLNEDRHASTGSARLEYRRGKRRVVLDGVLDSRHYISPPSDTAPGDIVMIDRELSARTSVKGDDELGALQLQGQAYLHYLARRSRHFSTFTLETESSVEDFYATRTGGAAIAAHPFGRRGRWVMSVIGSHERARVTDVSDLGNRLAEGDVTMVEAAGGLKYETTRWQLDGAAGAAVPLGVDASPWAEAKLVAKYQPRKGLELVATGGRKGRVPTLRERFDPRTGNPELDPEMSWLAELRAVGQLGERLRVEVAPYYRYTIGLIRLVDDPTPENPNRRRSKNLDRSRFLGVDTQLRYKPHRMIEVGGSYSYIRARSDEDDPTLAMAPLDRLPAHRADGWVRVSPDPRISLQARVRYFGEVIDQGALDPVPGYAMVEATLTAPITKQYLGVLRVDDLTNVKPETRTDFHAPGRVISLAVQASWE